MRQNLSTKHLHGKLKPPVGKSNGWQYSIWELQKYWVSFQGMQVLHLFQSAQLIQIIYTSTLQLVLFPQSQIFVVKCLSSLTVEREHTELLRQNVTRFSPFPRIFSLGDLLSMNIVSISLPSAVSSLALLPFCNVLNKSLNYSQLKHRKMSKMCPQFVEHLL